MRVHTFTFVGGLVFLFIALAHLLRIVFQVEWLVAGARMPLWMSWAALLIAGFLAYEGLRLSRSRRQEARNLENFRRAIDAFNRSDIEATTSYFADNVVYKHHARGLTFDSRQQVRQWLQEGIASFPDGKLLDVRFIAAGDTVAAQYIFAGTDTGGLGGLPATNRRMAVPVCEVYRFDRQGLIVAGELYFDLLSGMVQLGHAKPLSAAA